MELQRKIEKHDASVPAERALGHLQVNHISIWETKILVCDSVYWVNIHTDTENATKIALYVWIFRQHSQNIRCCHMRYQAGCWNLLKLRFFSINNKHYLCTVDYHNMFPVIKQDEGLSADKLIKHIRLSLQNMDFLLD